MKRLVRFFVLLYFFLSLFLNIALFPHSGNSPRLFLHPKWIAIDLLSQAEHDENAQSILITDDKKFGRCVEDEVIKLIEILPRKQIALTSWYNNGLILIVEEIKQKMF